MQWVYRRGTAEEQLLSEVRLSWRPRLLLKVSRREEVKNAFSPCRNLGSAEPSMTQDPSLVLWGWALSLTNPEEVTWQSRCVGQR